ncbi:MAG: dockerin type I repeat-containing protein [Ruminococcus sp.]|nr:dockerin type I repeat-containing protein [Ruminococcus sp.]
MRKFTKEITALIASVAIGTVAGIGAISASSEEIVQTAGEAMIPDETISTTEPEIPPVDGGLLPTDEWIEPTTEEEFPPTAGVDMPEPTTEEELPPLMGDIAPADGDVNGDGSFNVADVVLFQKWLLNVPDVNLYNWMAADLYMDGKLDVFDLCLMKKALIEKRHEVASDFYISMTGYSEGLLKLAYSDNPDTVITSTSELLDYIEQIYPEDKEQRLNSMKSKYNEDFFENNVLLLKAIYLPSTGYNYSIDNISYNKNKLIIDYTCKLDEEGCDVVNGLHGVVIIPKKNYHADSVEWRLTTIDPYGIKSRYIAVFNGEDGNTIHQTYVYKINNDAANYGFAYINADCNIKNWFTKVTGEGSVMWTDGVFPVAEANKAYDYVTIPGDETKYTIDEFMARFLMD